jgi:succinate dehydrogenase/fumarate reductase-like Fe-S protein
LVSFKTYEDISQLVPVMYDIKITEAEEKDLQASYNRTGIYCLGCEKCRQQCPGNLHIPDLMRAYMYAYGYRNLSKAQDVIAQHNLSDNPCGNCSTCNVNCTAGFNVKEKIADIIRLNKVPKEFLV